MDMDKMAEILKKLDELKRQAAETMGGNMSENKDMDIKAECGEENSISVFEMCARVSLNGCICSLRAGHITPHHAHD